MLMLMLMLMLRSRSRLMLLLLLLLLSLSLSLSASVSSSSFLLVLLVLLVFAGVAVVVVVSVVAVVAAVGVVGVGVVVWLCYGVVVVRLCGVVCRATGIPASPPAHNTEKPTHAPSLTDYPYHVSHHFWMQGATTGPSECRDRTCHRGRERPHLCLFLSLRSSDAAVVVVISAFCSPSSGILAPAKILVANSRGGRSTLLAQSAWFLVPSRNTTSQGRAAFLSGRRPAV